MSLIKDIEINSKELLEILNKYVKLADSESFKETAELHKETQKDAEPGQRERWTGEQYLNDLRSGRLGDHEGFPDHFVAINFKPNQPEFMYQCFKKDADHEKRMEVQETIYRLNEEMMTFLGVRNNALCAFYPPEGYISWHNNWNAPGYNLIFSWSETGDGWFKHLDPNTGKIVHHQDKPGWQLKAGYFGSHDEREKICWHTASTDCRRITVSFIFDHSDMALNLQDDVIAEISDP
jgi:hypothetical protein